MYVYSLIAFDSSVDNWLNTKKTFITDENTNYHAKSRNFKTSCKPNLYQKAFIVTP